jgi:predicted sulfurtransferase
MRYGLVGGRDGPKILNILLYSIDSRVHNMTYVDDDDFDDVQASDSDEEIRRDEAGRCDECGLKVKKEDSLLCPMCSAVYHRWCAGAECNVCKTQFEIRAEVRSAKPRKKTKR